MVVVCWSGSVGRTNGPTQEARCSLLEGGRFVYKRSSSSDRGEADVVFRGSREGKESTSREAEERADFAGRFLGLVSCRPGFSGD